MILSDSEILRQIDNGNIVIAPFDPDCLGSNSYDVHLGDTLVVYDSIELDANKYNLTREIKIPKEGIVLNPQTLYLGVTKEYTECHKHVPFLEGKSSIGRLGINIHATAGKGDVGFCNTWTMEISVIHPVRVYAGMRIGQLIFFEVAGEVMTPYTKKKDAKYTQITDKPVPSLMWK
jgi:dCTP deaminase